jgi:hypothetical protein
MLKENVNEPIKTGKMNRENGRSTRKRIIQKGLKDKCKSSQR